ncbi:MAG: reverse gyrase [Chlorobi bacterium]|nr:reverse gyrase [Chlorobiota bacterium]
MNKADKAPLISVYKKLCPVCGEEIDNDRLWLGLPCRKCVPDPAPLNVRLNRGLFKRFYKTQQLTTEFSKFFKKATGFDIARLQVLWTKRFFLGESFAIMSPPGLGKTTWGLTLSLFIEGKVLILVPTRLLGEQVLNRLSEYASKTNSRKRILFYKSSQKIKKQYENGEYDILIGTTRFFYLHLSELKKVPFSFIFIDDVDSFLKQPRSVERLMNFLNIPYSLVQKAMEPNLPPEDLNRLYEQAQRFINKQLIISSATLKPRPAQIRLFRRLLGFDIQKSITTLRQITDAKKGLNSLEEIMKRAVEIIKEVGSGGLVFLSPMLGSKHLDSVLEHLRNNGINAISYTEHSTAELIKIMQSGEFDVAVGIAHAMNPLVRGIDLPSVLKYAIFLEPPVFMFPLKQEPVPSRLYVLLINIVNALPEDLRTTAFSWIQYLRDKRYISAKAIEGNPTLKSKLEQIASTLQQWLNDPGIQRKLNESDDVFIKFIDGQWYIIIGDATSYIQASGRTSRLTPHGLTEGLSIVLYSEPKAMRSLEKRLNIFFPSAQIQFKNLDELNLQEIKKRLIESRQETVERNRPSFSSTLVIVESPTKAKTLASFIGTPQMRKTDGVIAYEVPGADRMWIFTASLGHITDLITDEGYWGVRIGGDEGFLPVYNTIKHCDTEKGRIQFTDDDPPSPCSKRPISDKKEIIDGLRKLAFQVDEVIIATDPDTEGEKIGFDNWHAIRPYQRNVLRSEFHEITPAGFKKAIQQARIVNFNWVKAQIARRIADRWVGFYFSQYLWKRFRNKFLSAGRVQTPVLKWVIDRTLKARTKVPVVTFKVQNVQFELPAQNRQDANQKINLLRKANITLSDEKTTQKNPAPPFTTDKILQEANTLLRIDVNTTMKLLQELFENGLITYHRTDSTHVSDTGIYAVAKPFIVETAGEEYFYPRHWGQEGTHEAIRPTRPLTPDDLTIQISSGIYTFSDNQKALHLYDLIFFWFMASQASPAKVKQATLSIMSPDGNLLIQKLVITQIEFDGYLKFAHKFVRLEQIDPSQPLKLSDIKITHKPLEPPFTQGELIKTMKERKLGRPSTYAKIVETLLNRKYVSEHRGRLYATKLGMQVYKCLLQDCPIQPEKRRLLSEDFTRELEELMDRISEGEERLKNVLNRYFTILELRPVHKPFQHSHKPDSY